MNKLLHADFSRLWKNKYFWGCMGAMLFYYAFYMVQRCQFVLNGWVDVNVRLEHYYFQFAYVIGLPSGIFATLFIGQEYSGGAIRNKIIAGHSKRDIYLSLQVVVFAVSLLMVLVGMVVGLIGIPVLGVWGMGAGQMFLYLLITAMLTLVFCAVYTGLNVLVTNRTLSAVLTLFVFFGLIFLSMKLDEMLAAPMNVFSEISFTGEEVNFADPMPNPRYLTGIKREVIDFIIDVLPTGQGERVAYLWVEHPVRMLLSSVVLTVLVTAFGILRFRKKD